MSLRSSFFRTILSVTLLVGIQSGTLLAQENRTTALHAEQVVNKVVGEKGHSFLGQGSWLNENKKFGKTSDVDLETFVSSKKPTDPSKVAKWRQDLIKKWKQSQQDLIKQIKSQYPPDKAREMLKKMNVYPPSQLMDDAADAGQAVGKFKEFKSVPNLAAVDDLNTGKIPSVNAIPADDLHNVTEGFYGPDARRWIQADRAAPGNGRVFYKDTKTGRAMSSRFMDLEHLAQGGRKFTAKGSANLSNQLIDKIMDDIRLGDTRKAAKNIQRLKAELKILKNKSGVSVDLSEIDDLLKQGKIGKAKNLLAGAKLRCEFVKQGGKLSKLERLLNKGGKASAKLLEKLSKLPWDKIGKAVNGVLITFQAIQMGANIAEGNYAQAMVDLGLALSPATIAILGTLTQAMLEAAKECGYNLVAGRQDCLDMLSGIYPDNPVTVTERKSATVSMETLLLKYAAADESKLQSLIRGHASQSTNKEGAAVINEAKCLRSIVPSWKHARMAYGKMFQRTAESIQITVDASIVKEEDSDSELDNIELMDFNHDNFMRELAYADRAAGEVADYTAAFQNSIGAQDADPCTNPSIAYFWRMAKVSFDVYADAVSTMATIEYEMQARLATMKKSLKAPQDPEVPPVPGETVRASVVYIGNSFSTLQPRLDAFARMVSAAGGYTTSRVEWYMDGEKLSTTGTQSVEIEDVQPGPHNIECALKLFPYGPKDRLLEGLLYTADFFGGTRVNIPEPPADRSAEIREKQSSAVETFETVTLPQIEALLTEKLNGTASLGEMVAACRQQLDAHGCDLTEVEILGEDIAQNGLDPDDVTNGYREICGDGIDNNGNGRIDEDCAASGNTIIIVWDSGTLADDSFMLSVTGYGSLGSTPAGGERSYTLDLPPGSYTATLTCLLAPDDAGTYSISFGGSAMGTGGTGELTAGGSASFEFTVQ